ncbi:MAG: Lrp/AsnC family transcriptional regulator [Sulfolobales archaeon]
MSELLDEKDLKILSILINNSRTSYVDIAREVGISDVAVIKRIKKLESLGVIKKYTTIVDPRKLEYKSVSFTGVDVDPQYLYDVLTELKAKDYVKYLSLTSGDHSIIMVIWARDSDEMAKIHREISNLPGVKRVCPSIVLDVIKE